MATGVIQGCVLSPLFFAIAAFHTDWLSRKLVGTEVTAEPQSWETWSRHAQTWLQRVKPSRDPGELTMELRNAAEEILTDTSLSPRDGSTLATASYLDDATAISNDTDRVLQFFLINKASLAAADLTVNPLKSELLVRSNSKATTAELERWAAVFPGNIKQWGSHDGPTPPQDQGIKLAGNLIGSDEFISRELEKLIDTRLRASRDALMEFDDFQGRHLLWRLCMATKTNFHYRTVSPTLTGELARQMDHWTLECLSNISGLDAALLDNDAAFTPIRWGGLGFTRQTDLRYLARLGALAQLAKHPWREDSDHEQVDFRRLVAESLQCALTSGGGASNDDGGNASNACDDGASICSSNSSGSSSSSSSSSSGSGQGGLCRSVLDPEAPAWSPTDSPAPLDVLDLLLAKEDLETGGRPSHRGGSFGEDRTLTQPGENDHADADDGRRQGPPSVPSLASSPSFRDVDPMSQQVVDAVEQAHEARATRRHADLTSTASHLPDEQGSCPTQTQTQECWTSAQRDAALSLAHLSRATPHRLLTAKDEAGASAPIRLTDLKTLTQKTLTSEMHSAAHARRVDSLKTQRQRASDEGDTATETRLITELTCLHAASAQHSGLHFQVWPTEPTLRIGNAVFRELLRWRVGAPFSFQHRLQGFCAPQCDKDLHAASDPYHVSTCKLGGLFHRPHMAATEQMKDWLKQFLPSLKVTAEPHVGDGTTAWRTDLKIEGFMHTKTSKKFHLDLTGEHERTQEREPQSPRKGEVSLLLLSASCWGEAVAGVYDHDAFEDWVQDWGKEQRARVAQMSPSLDLRVTKALGDRGYDKVRVSVVTYGNRSFDDFVFDVVEPFATKWTHSYDLGERGVRCHDASLLMEPPQVTEDAGCLEACNRETRCAYYTFFRRAALRQHRCVLWTADCVKVNAPFALGTYRKLGQRFLHSALVNVKPGENRLMIGGQEVVVRHPARGAGVSGVIWADPCMSSRWVGCVWGEWIGAFDRSHDMLNAVAQDPNLSFFQILGDNFYDQDGRLTQAMFDGFSLQSKSLILQTVAGNHDIWVAGGPPGDLAFDQFGHGFMQFYAQDTLAAFLNNERGNPSLFDRSVDPNHLPLPPGAFHNSFLNDHRNFFWYHVIGNVGFAGFVGAASLEKTLPDLERACAFFERERPPYVVVLGHWNEPGDGADANMTVPAVREVMLHMPGCQLGTRLLFFEGHEHCNRVEVPGVGFMIGGHGMTERNCQPQFGFAFLETDQDGALRVWYFPEFTRRSKANHLAVLKFELLGSQARTQARPHQFGVADAERGVTPTEPTGLTHAKR
ncbi:Hypothetical protein SCF082_LOCUS46630, partial [Durusdinium trenchii]